ncbi:hypothetical protein NNO_0865 [Hydrogenimonas sp.]|nr:hypothetical protein NNO_0865 [Hydrogenimonas sp.]
MPDILDSITAIHSREERYARLELLYRSEEEREKIFDALNRLSYRKECNVEVSDTNERDGRGIVSIEFHDDYDKESGPFFDSLMRKLGIDRCS